MHDEARPHARPHPPHGMYNVRIPSKQFACSFYYQCAYARAISGRVIVRVIEVIQRQNSVYPLSASGIRQSSRSLQPVTGRLASPRRSTNQVHTASIPWIQSFNRGIRSAL